jgi:hypothetical protein
MKYNDKLLEKIERSESISCLAMIFGFAFFAVGVCTVAKFIYEYLK